MVSHSVSLNASQQRHIELERALQQDFKKSSSDSSMSKYTGRCVAVTDDGFYLANIDGLTFFPCTKECPPENAWITVTKNNENDFSYKIDTPFLATKEDFRRSAFGRLQNNDLRMVGLLRDRSLFFRGVRNFFDALGFQELHTPTLVESPGIEKYLEVFSTEYQDFDGSTQRFFLPTSPEFSLKEALSAGLPKIYEIAKCFRNAGECSQTHRPEFFMLEWYRAYEDYSIIMQDCVELVLYLSQLLYGRNQATFRGHTVNLQEYKCFTVRELFARENIELDNYSLEPELFKKQVRESLELSESDCAELTKEDLFFKVMLNRIEPFLGMECPTFIHEYPLEMTPLSEKSSPLYGKRFELYLCGVELANGYGELVDAVEQERRFVQVMQERESVNASPLGFPSRFIKAMKIGMPPSSGVALGLERLLMILAGTENLGDTLLIDSFSE
ncbi:MAG: amino acid--tRNA ligase-related protein [Spirochaetota bacterium]|nr:amino acid--tRNA ligase-related protein [Spirochaetota bacterium]